MSLDIEKQQVPRTRLHFTAVKTEVQENSLAESNVELLSEPAIPLQVYTQEIQTCIHTNTRTALFTKGKKWTQRKRPTIRMEKCNVVPPHSAVLLSHQKERRTATRYSMEEP